MTLPETIETIAIPKTGGIELLEKVTLPFPKVEPNHIVVKVEWGGVNFIDTYFRQGLYPLKSFPAPIGKEATGTIVQLPTDEKVLNDPAFKKFNFAVGSKIGTDALGAHATYISIPWTNAYPVPESVDTRLAAAALLQALTAVSFVEEAYPVQKGDIVLVHTAAGGLGLLLVQLIKHLGATVIGTTSTAAKAAIAKEHGADHMILYKSEDTLQRVLEITNGEGVHAVFDGVGKDTFETSLAALRRKGTLVGVGNASGAIPPVSPLRLAAKNIKLLRPTMNNYVFTPEEKLYYTNKVWDYVQKGVLKINIFKEYPFSSEGVREAQTELTTGKTTGKLLIKIAA
ncbi:NAD(P)-binding protein [Schizophyllum commune Tattone D]|nr:NAD(P)-binding protein [Schizophyllum commune Tattone D]